MDVDALEYTHPTYDDEEPKRRLARRHYQAAVDEIRLSDLMQRKQGESNQQFDERQSTADYFPAFGTVVDSYVGQIGQTKKKVDRTWREESAEGGIPPDLAEQLTQDTDGRGTNWDSMREDAIVTLITENVAWGIVEGYIERNGQKIGGPHVRVISPGAVKDWQEDALGLKWVKVEHTAFVRDGPAEPAEERTRYTIYYRDFYEVYEVVEDGENKTSVPLLDEQGNAQRPYGTSLDGGDNSFRYKSRNRVTNTLPIFRVNLRLKRYVGHILADKNKVLFNKESERDNLLRVANTPKGVYVGHIDELVELQKKQRDANQASNLWNLRPDASQKHYYMAPPTESAEIATEVLREKIETFFVAAFQFYENSVRGREKTATEIEQDASRGEWSFLNSVATSIDEFEQAAMWRLEQIASPDSPDSWGQATVETPKTFKPANPSQRGSRLHKLFFGENTPVPIGETGKQNAAKEIAELEGIEYDEAEIGGELGAKAEAEALRRRREQMAAQADARAVAAEEQINGEADG